MCCSPSRRQKMDNAQVPAKKPPNTRLQYERELNGWSQEYVAEKVGTTAKILVVGNVATISQYRTSGRSSSRFSVKMLRHLVSSTKPPVTIPEGKPPKNLLLHSLQPSTQMDANPFSLLSLMIAFTLSRSIFNSKNQFPLVHIMSNMLSLMIE